MATNPLRTVRVTVSIALVILACSSWADSPEDVICVPESYFCTVDITISGDSSRCTAQVPRAVKVDVGDIHRVVWRIKTDNFEFVDDSVKLVKDHWSVDRPAPEGDASDPNKKRHFGWTVRGTGLPKDGIPYVVLTRYAGSTEPCAPADPVIVNTGIGFQDVDMKPASRPSR
jgi:hypothetical protein